MDKIKIEEYLKKLKDIDSRLNIDEDNLDVNVFSDINEIVKNIDVDIKKEMSSNDELYLPIKVKKLNNVAVIPKYAKFGDAGLDLTITRIVSETEDKIIYGTDLSIEIPIGYVGLIFPRSSIRKYQLSLTNSVGVIDSGYRGEIQGTFNKLNGEFSEKYKVGERGMQIIILPFPKVKMFEYDELTETERGKNGHGHTGK